MQLFIYWLYQLLFFLFFFFLPTNLMRWGKGGREREGKAGEREGREGGREEGRIRLVICFPGKEKNRRIDCY